MKVRSERDPASPRLVAGPFLFVACVFTCLWNGWLGGWPGHPEWLRAISFGLTSGLAIGTTYFLIWRGMSMQTPRLQPAGGRRRGDFPPPGPPPPL